jgi:hypothetical protein
MRRETRTLRFREVGRSVLNEQFADPPTPIALKHYSYRGEVSRTLLLVLIIV